MTLNRLEHWLRSRVAYCDERLRVIGSGEARSVVLDAKSYYVEVLDKCLELDCNHDTKRWHQEGGFTPNTYCPKCGALLGNMEAN